MLQIFKKLIKEEEGMGVVEIVLIIAVLVAIAIIFRGAIVKFVTTMTGKIFGDDAQGNFDLNKKE